MEKLTPIFIVLIGATLGATNRPATAQITSVLVTFDQQAAKAIDSTPCTVSKVQPNTTYAAQMSLTVISGSKVSFSLFVSPGIALSGSGTLKQSTSETGQISVQNSSLISGDVGCLIKSRYTISYQYFP